MNKTNFDLNLLSELISIRSLSSNQKACLRALRLIKSIFKQLQIPVLIKKSQGGLFLVAGEPKSAQILFLGHLDVVPALKSQFRLTRKGDKLFGRGVLDMKGPLVVLIQVLVELWQEGKEGFLLAITTDEEVGGFKGSALLAKRLKRIKLVIIPDAQTEKIVLCQKAPFHIKIFNKQGRSTHGSTPWKGMNAAQETIQAALEVVAKVNQGDPRETSAALTQIQAGTATNIIPDQAWATLDIRIKNKKEVEVIRKTINSITQKHNCKWKAIDQPLFFEIEQSNSFIKKWSESFRKVTGKKPSFSVEAGASDARFFHQAGIPAIITSARGSGIHSSKEWVSLRSLEQLSQTLKQFCQDSMIK